MSLMWFLAGFFIGGSIGTLIMAAASLAGRSEKNQTSPGWLTPYENPRRLDTLNQG